MKAEHKEIVKEIVCKITKITKQMMHDKADDNTELNDGLNIITSIASSFVNDMLAIADGDKNLKNNMAITVSQVILMNNHSAVKDLNKNMSVEIIKEK